jgi:hypothetical protein
MIRLRNVLRKWNGREKAGSKKARISKLATVKPDVSGSVRDLLEHSPHKGLRQRSVQFSYRHLNFNDFEFAVSLTFLFQPDTYSANLSASSCLAWRYRSASRISLVNSGKCGESLGLRQTNLCSLICVLRKTFSCLQSPSGFPFYRDFFRKCVSSSLLAGHFQENTCNAPRHVAWTVLTL